MRLVIATANPDKRQELERLLQGMGVELLTLSMWPEYAPPPETGTTLEENAGTKALAAAGHTGLPALADDTGLEVKALAGQPGVFSARFAGEDATYADNRAKLLAALKDVAEGQRGAVFRTVAALAFPDGRYVTAQGECHGQIALEERGGSGFGYDAVFYVPEQRRTFAEMDEDQKNAVSHRGMALRRMREVIRSLLNASPS